MEQNSKFTQWLIAHSGGRIKDKKQANTAIIVFSLVAIVISVFLFSVSVHSTPSSSAKTGTQIPPGITTPTSLRQ